MQLIMVIRDLIHMLKRNGEENRNLFENLAFFFLLDQLDLNAAFELDEDMVDEEQADSIGLRLGRLTHRIAGTV